MNIPLTEVSYSIIIETNLYAGNFEREMTAFATGCVGTCEVGDEHIKSFNKAVIEIAGFTTDEVNYDDFTTLDNKVSDVIRYEDQEYDTQRPCAIAWVPAHPKHAEGAGYYAVEIFLTKKPEDDILRFIEQRVHEFADQYDEDMKIIGIMLRETTKTTVEVDTRI